MAVDNGTVESRRAAQEREGRQRSQTTDKIAKDAGTSAAELGDEAGAVDVAVDDAGGDDIAPAQRQQAQEDQGDPAPKLIVQSPHDARRAEIAANFRKSRLEDINELNENAREISDLVNGGLPLELQQQEPEADADVVEDEVVADAADLDADPNAGKTKVTIRGEDRWLTEKEIIEAAQKTLAADDYLKEARTTLDEAKALRQEISGTRQPPASKHPAGEDDATEADATAETPPDIRARAMTLINDIQFGEPDDVADKLLGFIQEVSSTSSRSLSVQERRQAEHTRSMAKLKEISDGNPEIRDDRMASKVIEQSIYDLQFEDLEKAGVDTAQFRGDPSEVNKQVANAHLMLRADGFPVRSVVQLFEKAKEDFLSWRPGSAPAAKTQEPADRQQRQQPAARVQEQPANPAAKQQVARDGNRVEVNVDRTARRAAIAPTPSRAVAPRPDASNQTPQPRDRSQVVQDMKNQRAMKRGHVVV